MPTSQPDFTIDDLAEMMALLDKDGNQDVSKEEFKEYCARAMGVAEDTFEKMWKLIDDNGDGILQFSELCSYFGVSVESAEEGAKAKKEMSDEDILAMLELSSKMYEEKEKLKVEENEKKKKALSKRVGSGARAGVTLIKKDNKDCKEYELLEACELLTKDDRDAAMALLGWKPPQEAGMLGTWEAPLVPSVRIEDFEKREMPLHKLARNHEHTLIKRLYDLVVEDAKGGKEIATSDINSQNKDGKTPLMLAVEGNVAYLNSIEGDAAKLAAYREKQVKTVELLLSCTADMYAESMSNNWNTLHCAAHGNSYEAAQSIFTYMAKHSFSTLAVRMLVNHPDKDGRTPLHIAAMRADPSSTEPPFVQLLLNKGADPLIRDKCPQGLTASVLAEKAGRRNSKELLDKAADDELAQRAAYKSRRKSLSRDNIPDISAIPAA